MIKNRAFSLAFLVASLIVIFNFSAAQSVISAKTPLQGEQLQTLLSEAEFKQLLIASLANDVNGQKLLAVTDALDAKIHSDHIEFSAVINLDKVEKVSPEARKNVEKFDSFFFFLDQNKLNVTVFGEPVARNGEVGIRDNFSIKLGPIPLSNSTLRQLGVEVSQANTTNLKLNGLAVKSIEIEPGSVILSHDIN